MKLQPGLVYELRVADDPATYRAMRLYEPKDPMDGCWYVYDNLDGMRGRVLADRYVEVVGVDAAHAADVMLEGSKVALDFAKKSGLFTEGGGG